MNQESVIQLLQRHPFLQRLTEKQLQKLESCTKLVGYKAQEFLLQEGQEADCLYLIQSGLVSLEIHVPGKGIFQMETLRGGDILGLSWLVPPARWHLDAQAREPVHTLRIEAQALRRAMDDDPVFGYAIAMDLLRHVIQRLERVRLQRLDLYKGDA